MKRQTDSANWALGISRLFAVAPAVGVVVGVITGLVLTIMGGTNIGFAWIVVLFAGISSGFFSLLSVLLTVLSKYLLRRLMSGPMNDVLCAGLGSLAGSVLTYLLFFLRQDAWNPVVFIVVPAALFAILLFFLLRYARNIESR